MLQLLNKYYDSIYVLTIDSAKERQALFKERFNQLNFTFFTGVDKNTFTEQELISKDIYNPQLAIKNHRYSKSMKPGEIACAWGHLMIYQHMLSSNHKRILIMEDDAVPNPAMIEKIGAVLNEIPEDCELLFWGWDKNADKTFRSSVKQAWYHVQHSFGLLKWDHRTISHLYARPYSAHLRKAGFHDYTYAYAISRSAAEKLIPKQTPVQYIADNLLAHASTSGLLTAYITYPAVFLHDTLPDGSPRPSYIR